MIRCGFAVVAVWGPSLPSPAQLPVDGTRLGPVRRGIPSAGRRLPIECEAVRAGRPTSPGPPRWMCRTQTRWTIRRFERRHGSGCSSMAPIRCFIRHHPPIPTSVPDKSPVAWPRQRRPASASPPGLGNDARAGGGDGSGVLVLRIGVHHPPRIGSGLTVLASALHLFDALRGRRFRSRKAVASPRPHPTRGELSDRGESAARTAQPIELSLRSPQITPPGVMPGWCAGRPGAATSMTRRTASWAAAHGFPVAWLRLPRCQAVRCVMTNRRELFSALLKGV